MSKGLATALGVAATVLVVGAVAFGAYELGHSDSTSTAAVASSPSPNSALSAVTEAARHARSACGDYHRPSQIAFDERRAVTNDEVSHWQFEARTEASLAASLDSRWGALDDAVDYLVRNSTLTAGKDSASDTDKWLNYFAVLRAQCMLAGAGDINQPDLN